MAVWNLLTRACACAGAAGALSVLLFGASCSSSFAGASHESYLSPSALAVAKDGKSLFVACATANCILRLDLPTRKVVGSVPVPGSPSGLAVSTDGSKLFVTCAAPQSTVCILDVAKPRILATIAAGHTATAPVVSPDGRTLYVCNRFNNDVSVIDLGEQKELRRLPVRREPVAAAITPDGKYLLVANSLPTGPATARWVCALVSVIDLTRGVAVRELHPPNGSTSLTDLRISPDGKFAAVTHLLGHFQRPADRVTGGWLNVNALTLIDVCGLQTLHTVLLDDPYGGAANPWGLGWSADGATLAVAHAGTHEVSLIDFPGLLAKLRAWPRWSDPIPFPFPRREVADELGFLEDLRQRIPLPESDRGPRSLVVVGATAYVANYFSDSVSAVPLGQTNVTVDSLPLTTTNRMDSVRKGEFYFHDASICYQGWQSCSSCHPGDARTDGLNWDLLNDGQGNPKNTKSLLWVHKTPPAMSLAVRDTAEVAVRAGIEKILFTRQAEEVPAAMDEYLKSLKPVPSPFLPRNGQSRAQNRRGEQVFRKAGCDGCHTPPLFTDLHQYDVGTGARFDQPGDEFDVPTLVELWRTAPYLHDGSAATVREVVTSHNPRDQHGNTSGLSSSEIEDLCAYLLSL